jgi:hypothetical protein
MQLSTKYDLGYTYWVPRVVKTFDRTEVLNYEGEEWTRDVYEMRAFVKQKVIKTIQVNVHHDNVVAILYGVVNTDNENDLLSFYPEAMISEHTEESALIFAESYLKDNPDKEYFGN